MLTHSFVSANRYDSVIDPELLQVSEDPDLDIVCALGDAAYDSREICETTESLGIEMITGINQRNGKRKGVRARYARFPANSDG